MTITKGPVARRKEELKEVIGMSNTAQPATQRFDDDVH